MSAWIVTKRHVAAIVRYAHRTYTERDFLIERFPVTLRPDQDPEVEPPPPWPVFWCNKLMQKNVDSVNHRYAHHAPETAQVLTYADLQGAPDLSVVELLKAINCLQYQSCEQDDYYETIEYKFLRQLHDGAVHELPGYDAAPWGIE